MTATADQERTSVPDTAVLYDAVADALRQGNVRGDWGKIALEHANGHFRKGRRQDTARAEAAGKALLESGAVTKRGPGYLALGPAPEGATADPASVPGPGRRARSKVATAAGGTAAQDGSSRSRASTSGGRRRGSQATGNSNAVSAPVDGAAADAPAGQAPADEVAGQETSPGNATDAAAAPAAADPVDAPTDPSPTEQTATPDAGDAQATTEVAPSDADTPGERAAELAEQVTDAVESADSPADAGSTAQQVPAEAAAGEGPAQAAGAARGPLAELLTQFYGSLTAEVEELNALAAKIDADVEAYVARRDALAQLAGSVPDEALSSWMANLKPATPKLLGS